MDNHRYPHDIELTTQHFEDCGWKDVVDNALANDSPSLWFAFSGAARKALDDGRLAEAKVLWLFSDICSMLLTPTDRNDPFKPVAASHERRSTVPDDLNVSDINFLSIIAERIDLDWLRARIADIVWLKLRPRNKDFALMAIDAYRATPLDFVSWLRHSKACWERAISLAKMLGRGAADRLQLMQDTVIAYFDQTTNSDRFHAIRLVDLLKQHKLGDPNHNAIAQKLESIAYEFHKDGKFHEAREFFSATADWYAIARDDDKSVEMTVAIAECWVKEADERIAGETPSHMVANSFYENAIQTYRTIPRADREPYNVENRIETIRSLLNASGEKTLEELKIIRSPAINISELIDSARNSVSGLTAQDALKAFASIHSPDSVAKLRKQAIEQIRKFPFSSLFGGTSLSRDGRVIAKRPGMMFGTELLTESDEIAIRAEMVRNYSLSIIITSQGMIIPALEVLGLEHRIIETDFVWVASQSPVVPKSRSALFGKALYAGYKGDFVTALHILIPQIEHMVRSHLKQAGVQTTNLDVNGIENENGLSTLLALPETKDIFGEDLTFEFSSLFCDAFGPNLRNELAHGLLESDAFESQYAVYAWWLGVRLVFLTWWNALREKNAEQANLPEAAADANGEP